MRIRRATPIVLLAGILPSVALARYHVPAHHQRLPAAVRRAERRGDLWATVNICNTPAHRHTIGIRGQMPALGYRARLSMDIQVDYWAGSREGFVPDPGVHHHIDLGVVRRGLHQAGYTFQFAPPATLSGQITFSWRQGRHEIAKVTVATERVAHHVDFGDPRGYSAATCQIAS